MPNEISLRIHRDENGAVHPIEGVSPMLSIPVKIVPLSYGASRKLESFGEALSDWSDEDKIYVINNHVAEPEIHIKDEDDLYDGFEAWTIEDLMQAVFLYSGLGRLYDPSVAEGNLLEKETES